MNVAIAYCFPQVKQGTYYPLARRFADTWRQYPPGKEPYSLYVIGNGGPVPTHAAAMFEQGAKLLYHTNVGWDIGAFQYAAETIECDLLVCLGAPVHFHRFLWLDRMVAAYIENGPALYGCWAYLSPNWHVRTTCFWCPPELLKSYPYEVGSTKQSRYEFEHGNNSFTRHVLKAGFPCIMVTRDGWYPFEQWETHAPGVEQSLVLDQHIHR